MNVVLPLDKMTTAEKLDLMQVIWSDLARAPDEIPGPAWHHDLLEERQRRIDSGNEVFWDWEDAKVMILKEVKTHSSSATSDPPQDHGT